jgi:hypothetical protein
VAIVQTTAQLQAIGRRVGVPLERAADIKAISTAVTTTAGLRTVVNRVGYYDEKADQLVAAGVTFA